MSTEIDADLAPEFPSGAEWLNAERPLRLRDLRGKVVLLYFWTYSCLHCQHVLPELSRLQQKHVKEMVVVGIHSAKFTETQETENLRQAVRRLGVTHPVMNDRQMVLWRLYRIQTWPTVVLVDPEGREVGRLSGDRIFEVLDQAIGELVNSFSARRLLDLTPWAGGPETEEEAALLSFPAKMVVEPELARGFITDTNHHRLLVVSLAEARVLEVIGSGEAGFVDGHFAMAQFRRPQGLTWAEGKLYVADTENHSVRLVDLERRTVLTLAGTGEQAPDGASGGRAREVPLNSPWDVVVVEEAVYITLAGAHQVWRLDLDGQEVRPHAGTGQKARVDGPLSEAAFAQPAGLTTDGTRLYVVEGETSALRAVDTDPQGEVVTLAGGDLFAFGDRDGPGLLARFQHPLGIAYADGVLYIADSYNHKVKTYTLKTGRCETLFADPDLLREPRGLFAAEGRLYLADANAHAIRVADLRTRRLETLSLQAQPEPTPAPTRTEFFGQEQARPPQTIGSGEAVLTASVAVPPGHHLSEEAPNEVRVRVLGEIATNLCQDQQLLHHPSFPVQLPVQLNPGDGQLEVDLTLYYCEEGNGAACRFREARLVLPVHVEMSFPGHALQVSFDITKD